MHRLTPMTTPNASRKRQRGITLIESLVAIVVAALGILGVVGVQMRTLVDTQTTVHRAQAIRLIEDLGERMRVNPNATGVINTYVSGFSDSTTPVDCATGCNQAAQATYDLAVWKETVGNTLPLGEANIFLASDEGTATNPNRRQLGVMISWRENERDTSTNYKNQIDATNVLNAAGALVAGADNATCPAGRTCHLQYIPVGARCAPYNPSPGVGATQYYCSGS